LTMNYIKLPHSKIIMSIGVPSFIEVCQSIFKDI
jgi:hypothetical protein